MFLRRHQKMDMAYKLYGGADFDCLAAPHAHYRCTRTATTAGLSPQGPHARAHLIHGCRFSLAPLPLPSQPRRHHKRPPTTCALPTLSLSDAVLPFPSPPFSSRSAHVPPMWDTCGSCSSPVLLLHSFPHATRHHICTYAPPSWCCLNYVGALLHPSLLFLRPVLHNRQPAN
jgi:hypothetical protein